MKKILLGILVLLFTLTQANASTTVSCINAYGDVYGEKDTSGESYKQFKERAKSEKMSLDILVNYCKGTKYKADQDGLAHLTKYLGKQSKATKREWEKNYKISY